MTTTKYKCFIVAPMGEMSPDTQQDYDTMMEFSITPAINDLGFEVMQGRFLSDSGQVDEESLKLFRNADLCVADICDANPTSFYYELGKREGREKPTVLLKSVTVEVPSIPVPAEDCIEYDLSDRNYLREIKSKVTALIKEMLNGVLNKQSEVTLFSINDKIDRMMQIVSNMLGSRPVEGRSDDVRDDWAKENPMDLFKYALVKRDKERAEFAMDRLESTMDKVRFYDVVVEQTTALGSEKAAKMLTEQMEWFMEQDIETKKKLEYLGVLVSYLNRRNQELEYLERIEKVARKIMEDDQESRHSVHNQLNRLYYGIYLNDKKKNLHFLDKAIQELEQAIDQESGRASYYYNLALCYRARSNRSGESEAQKEEDFGNAVSYVKQCLEKQDPNDYDVDHLMLGCRLLRQAGDNEWKRYFSLLEKVSKMRYTVLKDEFDKEDTRNRVSQLTRESTDLT